jgi:hypothetical protein
MNFALVGRDGTTVQFRTSASASLKHWNAMRRAGVDDVCLLTRWAMANGLDEPLGPEIAEEREVPRPKVDQAGAVAAGAMIRSGRQ